MTEMQAPPLIAEYDAEQLDNRWCRRIAWALPSLYLVTMRLPVMCERLNANASRSLIGLCCYLLSFAVSWAWILSSLASIPVSLKGFLHSKRRAWSDRLICCVALAFGLFPMFYLALWIRAHE